MLLGIYYVSANMLSVLSLVKKKPTKHSVKGETILKKGVEDASNEME